MQEICKKINEDIYEIEKKNIRKSSRWQRFRELSLSFLFTAPLLLFIGFYFGITYEWMFIGGMFFTFITPGLMRFSLKLLKWN